MKNRTASNLKNGLIGAFDGVLARLNEHAGILACALGSHDFIKTKEYRGAGMGIVIISDSFNSYHEEYFVLTCKRCAARRRITEIQRGRGEHAKPIETKDVSAQLSFRDHGMSPLDIAVQIGSEELAVNIFKKNEFNTDILVSALEMARRNHDQLIADVILERLAMNEAKEISTACSQAKVPEQRRRSL